MTTITDFLEARIAEDELEAHVSLKAYERGGNVTTRRWWITLAVCAAHRRIIAGTYWEPKDRPTDVELHRRYRHPYFEYAVTQGQRKNWDEVDEPPEGEGWERNTARHGGWMRYDYTEESYWRRLKPEDERRAWQQYIPPELRALAGIYKDHPDYQEAWTQ